MTQLSKKEKQLVSLISEECSGPADLTAKLKIFLPERLKKC